MAEEEEDFTTTRKVFINYLDTYQSSAVVRELASVASFEIYGSIRDQKSPVMKGIYPLVTDVLFPDSFNFYDNILLNDFIIYDITYFNRLLCVEINTVLRDLDQWARTKVFKEIPVVEGEEGDDDQPKADAEEVKHFILISTPLTWAATPKKERQVRDEEDDEEDDPNFDHVLEEDYRKRRATPLYVDQKRIERQVIWLNKTCKGRVKAVVICPGVTYGGYNDVFHYLFRNSYYNKEVPLFNPGTQMTPLIHIEDFAGIIRNVIENFPPARSPYIFAVQPIMLSHEEFVKTFLRAVKTDCFKIRYLSEEEILLLDVEYHCQYIVDCLRLDIKMVPTYFANYPFKVMENFNIIFEGLLDKYREERELKNFKILIDGPPMVGKTELAKHLACSYHLNNIDFENIIQVTIDYLESKKLEASTYIENFCPYEEPEEEEENSVPEEVAEINSMVDSWNSDINELKEYQRTHKNLLYHSMDVLRKCMMTLLGPKTPNCIQGYIIDGFNLMYADAKDLLFYPADPDGFDEEESTTTMATVKTRKPISSCLVPTHLVILDSTDEFLCNRAVALNHCEAVKKKRTEFDMLARLEAYRDRDNDDTCLSNLFYDNSMTPIYFCVRQKTRMVEIVEKCKLEIGYAFIYPPTARELHQANKIKEEEEKRAREEEESRKKKILEKMRCERESKLRAWTKEYERLKIEENTIHEARTLPLAQYLTKYVLPTLTDGLLKIAELKPEDPVDFLAEYLFETNPHGHILSPAYEEKMKNKLTELQSNEIVQCLEKMKMAENVLDLDFGKDEENTFDVTFEKA